jgi:lipoprotein signal peptidase
MIWIRAISIIIVAEVVLTALSIFVFRSLWKRDSFFRSFAQNLVLACLTVLFTLTAIEIGLKLFLVQSDGINFTLASKSWFERYWRPINSMGFRDYEWTPEKLGNRVRVAVVGDSFVAGGGVANIEDRFSNQLGKRLGDDYAVMTVAQNGWNTQSEIDGLQAYPYRPDVVIFSYYINDIEDDGVRNGYSKPADLLIYPPDWLRPLVDHSYAFNFAYWRLFRWRAFADPIQRKEIQTYHNYLRAMYQDSKVWEAHQKKLRQVYDLAQANHFRLIVVAFPDMLRINQTRDLSGKAVSFFRELQVPVVDVAVLIDTQHPRSTIANSVDTHPSVEVHTLVANALYPLVIEYQKK